MFLLMLLAAALTIGGPAEIAMHSLDVVIDLPSHSLTASDAITLTANGRATLLGWLNKGFVIDEASAGGKTLTWRRVEGEAAKSLLKAEGFGATDGPSTASLLVIELPKSGAKSIKLRYHGEIYDAPQASEFSRESVADQTTGLISEEGIYIEPGSGWYLSQPMRLDTYRMKVSTPKGYEVMSEGDILGRSESGDRLITEFGSPHPFDGLHIIAGKYVVTSEKQGNVDVMTYFFPGSEDLTATYLRMSKQYVAMYSAMLGQYPFGKFAVVENFFPTGYGMPSFTLLGSQVIRLPFIPYTSLGHEVLHNWWGNSVYVDYKSGNWCEGLTSYGADYLYLEQKSAEDAAEYRRTMNRDYTNYVNAGNDFPLSQFLSRHDASTRAVGYGKTMMVFHTIRRAIGEEVWAQALKTFYSRMQWKMATWDDLLAVFTEVSGKPMDWIKDQYIERAGAPFISLAAAEITGADGTWKLDFSLSQAAPVYSLDVPVKVFFDSGMESRTVSLTTAKADYSFTFTKRPVTVSVDPDSELFRRMHRDEMPSVLSGVFGADTQLIVLPDNSTPDMQAAYAAMADALNRTRVASVKKANEVTDAELAGASVMVFGSPMENSLAARWSTHLPAGTVVASNGFTLLGTQYDGAGKGLTACFRNPANLDQGAVLVLGTDTVTLAYLGRILTHYGKYSYLAFDGGKNVAKGIWPVTDSPLIKHFGEE